jgi:hypothetical protein
MSIPLDRLYHYIKSIAEEACEDNIIIYHFWPHGSKNINNLVELRDSQVSNSEYPRVICHDQEPLDFEYYSQFDGNVQPRKLGSHLAKLGNFYNQVILIHSERRSTDVDQYQQHCFIPAYYWSHAVIARDWFRYARYVDQKKNIERRFLVYNRAWSGTREYRLGFADTLIRLGLVDHTLMRVSPIDTSLDKHYDLHHFKHPHWRPHNVLEHYFPMCNAESHYSADFDITDYESTDIEVVLETLFDDLRLHLTEKTLRPIAMGQPFILAATYGSLAYLRSYGFKTFSDCWDESYDMMSDSIERMNKITDVMSNITSMPPSKRDAMVKQAREIAVYNKQHFFSAAFQNQIVIELKNNLKIAYAQLTPKS